jgi:hypothetical protein
MHCGFRFCCGSPAPTFFFVSIFFLVFAIGPGEKELFLYWPASRYAGGATVFKVVAGSTG